MTTNERHRGRWLVVAAIAVLAVVGLAATAQGQDRVRGDVLLDDSLVGFPNAEDTVVEEVDERPPKRRADVSGVALRGSETVSDPTASDGRQDYLLGLSASSAIGIDDAVAQRYEHGTVEEARLHLTYNGGCNSPNGQLTVRAVETRSWSPLNVAWDDTSRSGNGSVDVQGPRLAQVAISPNAAQANPNVNCNEATIELATEPTSRILRGDLGGLAMFWSGEQELNVSTLDSTDRPRLELNLTTNGPDVHAVTVEDGFPSLLDTGERVTLTVNATDPETLPDDGVEIRITPHGGGDGYRTTLEAKRSGNVFVATQTFPTDAEGRYDVEARATDSDGWTAAASPNESGPHLVADGTPPNVTDATLAGHPANATVHREEGQTLSLTANATDLSCTAGTSRCGDWRLTWRGQTLAQGPLTPSQRIEADVPLPRPGNTTARLVVQDAAGHEHRSTTWQLDAADTHPPEITPISGTHLAPGQGTTLENGTPVEIRFQIEDDLPVDARLLLEGNRALERELPDHDDGGRVETQLEDVPEGTYQARLVLDDGTHAQTINVGELTIAPRGAPSVSVDVPSTRIGPDDVVEATVRDRDLDEERTSVLARVNGLEVQPDVDAQTVTGGQDLRIHLGNLSHDDEVEITVRAHDAQGLNATGSAEVTVDAAAPKLAKPGEETWLRPGETLRFEAEDPGQGRATLTIQGPQSRTTGPAPTTVGADRLVAEPGALTKVTVTLRDDLGNERTRTIDVGIDEGPPEAETTFTRDGLVVVAEDAASGVLRVDAAVGVDGDPLNETQVFQESPTRFFVTTGPLTRGDEIELAAQVRDEVGHVAELGTREQPLQLTVPDRPPTIELERTSSVVGATGQVNWSVQDPDQEPVDVTLRVDGPGQTTEDTVNAIGSREIAPEEPGRYTVTVEAESGQNTTRAQTFFYLGPEGRLTRTVSAPDDVDPGSPLTVELSFPGEPQRVFVTAVDEANASTSARVDLEGSKATATFDSLPEGAYDVRATVVYEEGATENAHVASVQSQEPIGDQLGNLVVPILVVLAILLVVAIAAVWYKRRQEEDEDAETEPGPGPT